LAYKSSNRDLPTTANLTSVRHPPLQFFSHIALCTPLPTLTEHQLQLHLEHFRVSQSVSSDLRVAEAALFAIVSLSTRHNTLHPPPALLILVIEHVLAHHGRTRTLSGQPHAPQPISLMLTVSFLPRSTLSHSTALIASPPPRESHSLTAP
jgi:hypothetical protein